MQTKWTTILPLLVLIALTALGAQWASSAPGSSIKALPPLSFEEEDAVSRLEEDVKAICATGERRPHATFNIKKSGEWIIGELRREGYDVEQQPFDAQGKSYSNLTARIPGIARQNELIVIGAHLDAPRNSGGADDNASGCAVLLELARVLQDDQPDRTLCFVFFGATEPPILGKKEMGSRVWLDAERAEGHEVVAMLSLDSLGYFVPSGSQSYPLPLRPFYPGRGDFVGFVSNIGSRHLMAECVSTFRNVGRIPSEVLTLPGWAPGMGTSDHATFWDAGIPALRVTDTHGWRNPNARTRGDVPGSLDYRSMARTVTGLVQVVRRISGRASSL